MTPDEAVNPPRGRWLAPLPVPDLLREAAATGRVLIVDETRRTGGVSEGIC